MKLMSKGILLFAFVASAAAAPGCDKSDDDLENSSTAADGSSSGSGFPGSSSGSSGSSSAASESSSAADTEVLVLCAELASEGDCEGAVQGDLECGWRRQLLVDVSGGMCSVEQADGCVARLPYPADPGCGPLEGCDEFAVPRYKLVEGGALFIEGCANPDAPDYTNGCGAEDLTEDPFCACGCAGI